MVLVAFIISIFIYYSKMSCKDDDITEYICTIFLPDRFYLFAFPAYCSLGIVFSVAGSKQLLYNNKKLDCRIQTQVKSNFSFSLHIFTFL